MWERYNIAPLPTECCTFSTSRSSVKEFVQGCHPPPETPFTHIVSAACFGMTGAEAVLLRS